MKNSIEGTSWCVVVFFCLRSSSSFCPHKTMEMQMLLISITSERTCSDYRISKEKGEREEDAERPMKEEKKRRKKKKKFHSAIHLSNTRARLNDRFSLRQDFKL